MHEALFVRLVRNWYKACDEWGMSTDERVNHLWAFYAYLTKDIEFDKFPGYGQYVKGIPVITYAGILQSISVCLSLYQITKCNMVQRQAYMHEALFVRLVRNWYKACDELGMSTDERVNHLWAFYAYLTKDIEFDKFPGYGQYVKGIPVITYAGILQNISVCLSLYQIAKCNLVQRQAYMHEALFVRLVRNWFKACDELGMSTDERVNHLWAFYAYLTKDIEFDKFPGYGQYVKGIPVITYAGILQNISVCLSLYKIAKCKTYNPRSISSLVC